jgi:hypothetical protein
MLKKKKKSLASRFLRRYAHSPTRLYAILLLAATTITLSGCDRGATEQIQAAQRFADVVVRNNTASRDSMIATNLFKKHFANDFVASDLIAWMRTIYDFHKGAFAGPARADVDRDLREDLSGGLIHPEEIEETGIVRVKSPDDGQPSAYFWMVRQKGRHWMVAMVTKGEMAVNFK